MSLFSSHRRCESIEALLRGRVVDLEEQVTRLYDRLEEQDRVHAAREADLLDRYMATTNPVALRELAAANRSAAPAAPMPAMVRQPMVESPGLRVGGGIAPRLTPQQTNFGRTSGNVASATATAAAPRPQSIPTSAAPVEDTE